MMSTKDEATALRQIEGAAHMALSVGEGLAATAEATIRGGGYHVLLTFDSEHEHQKDRWVEQVQDELFIARCTGLLPVAVAVTAA